MSQFDKQFLNTPLGDMLNDLEHTPVQGAVLGPPPAPERSEQALDPNIPSLRFSEKGQSASWLPPRPVEPRQYGYEESVPRTIRVAGPPVERGFITILGVNLSTNEVETTAGNVQLDRTSAEKVRAIAVKSVRSAIEEDLGGQRKRVRRVRRSRKPAKGVSAPAREVSGVREGAVAGVEPADGPQQAVPADGGGRKKQPRNKPRVSAG